MIDETRHDHTTAATGGDRVGFCQDCGKALTQETIRPVGSGVFCEPCLTARVGATNTSAYTAGAPAAGATYGAGPGYVAPPVGAIPVGSAPSPVLAGLLGIIPGVGAMYNGQYAKGLAHFAIFAVLMSLSDGHSLFGLMGAGWFFYQIFDAYHTAKARREGLPLPNPFGLNEIGERMGFGKNWPGSASRPVGYAQAPPPPANSWTPGTANPAAPVGATPDWVGYVPPTAFATSPPVAAPPIDPAAQAASWGSSPYQAPYAAPYVPVPNVPPVPNIPVPPAAGVPVPHKRFPVGAIWLIGLGLLFTVANFDSELHVSGLWLLTIFLAGLSVWAFVRRLGWLGGVATPAGIASMLRGPGMLMVLAVLFGLQAGHWFTFGQTWPVLLLALGALLLVERAFGGQVPSYPVPATPPEANVPEDSEAIASDDVTKGGQ